MAFLTADDIQRIIARVGGAATIGSDDQVMIATDLAPRAQASVKTYLGWSIEQTSYTEFLPRIDQRLPEAPLESRQFGSLSIDGPILATTSNSELPLTEKYLRSVTGVYENRSAFETDAVNGDWTNFQLTAGSDFTVDWDEPGLSFSSVLRRVGSWPVKARSVKVIYVAGLSANELATDRFTDIKEAAMLTIQLWYLDAVAFRRKQGQEGSGLVKSESLGDWSISYDQGGINTLLGISATLPPRAMSLLRKFKAVTKAFAI